jgi:hypothetical protein
MTTSRTFEYDLAEVRGRATERGCTREAVDRFAERYPEHCRFRIDGKPIGVVPRLRLALELAQQGKGREIPARGASLIRVPSNRKIFDVELPADDFNSAFKLRILTDATVSCVITVLPPEFRKDMDAKKKHRELRRIIEEDIVPDEPATEKVELPPPVEVGSSLADKMRAALSRKVA